MRYFLPTLIALLSLPLSSHAARSQDLYLADYWQGTITKIDTNGVTSLFASGIGSPVSLTFDNSGNLYVAGWSSGDVIKFDPNGTATMIATNIFWPQGLAFDSTGNLFYGSDGWGNLYRADTSGSTSVFATGFSWFQAIAFNSLGHMYVADQTSIMRVDTENGSITPFYTSSSSTFGGAMAFDALDNLFVPEYGAGTILKIATNASATVYASALAKPNTLAFDDFGDLYVAGQLDPNASDSGYLYRIDAEGNVTTIFSDLNNPSALAFFPVPEPSTYALLALGAIGAISFRLRRNKA